eukprot:gb/GEZN01000082.1/.p1 GENE.gb/GEZN01000082.1/~~gb/GEZN01000082.1/.p1  ORF type:complete len:2398 (-),score=369.44 gb/GEZN01000082.1/:201-7394(-)
MDSFQIFSQSLQHLAKSLSATSPASWDKLQRILVLCPDLPPLHAHPLLQTMLDALRTALAAHTYDGAEYRTRFTCKGQPLHERSEEALHAVGLFVLESEGQYCSQLLPLLLSRIVALAYYPWARRARPFEQAERVAERMTSLLGKISKQLPETAPVIHIALLLLIENLFQQAQFAPHPPINVYVPSAAQANVTSPTLSPTSYSIRTSFAGPELLISPLGSATFLSPTTSPTANGDSVAPVPPSCVASPPMRSPVYSKEFLSGPVLVHKSLLAGIFRALDSSCLTLDPLRSEFLARLLLYNLERGDYCTQTEAFMVAELGRCLEASPAALADTEYRAMFKLVRAACSSYPPVPTLCGVNAPSYVSRRQFYDLLSDGSDLLCEWMRVGTLAAKQVHSLQSQLLEDLQTLVRNALNQHRSQHKGQHAVSLSAPGCEKLVKTSLSALVALCAQSPKQFVPTVNEFLRHTLLDSNRLRKHPSQLQLRKLFTDALVNIARQELESKPTPSWQETNTRRLLVDLANKWMWTPQRSSASSSEAIAQRVILLLIQAITFLGSTEAAAEILPMMLPILAEEVELLPHVIPALAELAVSRAGESEYETVSVMLISAYQASLDHARGSEDGRPEGGRSEGGSRVVKFIRSTNLRDIPHALLKLARHPSAPVRYKFLQHMLKLFKDLTAQIGSSVANSNNDGLREVKSYSPMVGDLLPVLATLMNTPDGPALYAMAVFGQKTHLSTVVQSMPVGPQGDSKDSLVPSLVPNAARMAVASVMADMEEDEMKVGLQLVQGHRNVYWFRQLWFCFQYFQFTREDQEPEWLSSVRAIAVTTPTLTILSKAELLGAVRDLKFSRAHLSRLRESLVQRVPGVDIATLIDSQCIFLLTVLDLELLRVKAGAPGAYRAMFEYFGDTKETELGEKATQFQHEMKVRVALIADQVQELYVTEIYPRSSDSQDLEQHAVFLIVKSCSRRSLDRDKATKYLNLFCSQFPYIQWSQTCLSALLDILQLVYLTVEYTSDELSESTDLVLLEAKRLMAEQHPTLVGYFNMAETRQDRQKIMENLRDLAVSWLQNAQYLVPRQIISVVEQYIQSIQRSPSTRSLWSSAQHVGVALALETLRRPLGNVDRKETSLRDKSGVTGLVEGLSLQDRHFGEVLGLWLSFQQRGDSHNRSFLRQQLNVRAAPFVAEQTLVLKQAFERFLKDHDAMSREQDGALDLDPSILNLNLEGVMYRAAALLLWATEHEIPIDKQDLLHLICIVPVVVFSVPTMRTSVNVWSWLLARNRPTFEVPLMMEMKAAWARAVDGEVGLFAAFSDPTFSIGPSPSGIQPSWLTVNRHLSLADEDVDLEDGQTYFMNKEVRFKSPGSLHSSEGLAGLFSSSSMAGMQLPQAPATKAVSPFPHTPAVSGLMNGETTKLLTRSSSSPTVDRLERVSAGLHDSANHSEIDLLLRMRKGVKQQQGGGGSTNIDRRAMFDSTTRVSLYVPHILWIRFLTTRFRATRGYSKDVLNSVAMMMYKAFARPELITNDPASFGARFELLDLALGLVQDNFLDPWDQRLLRTSLYKVAFGWFCSKASWYDPGDPSLLREHFATIVRFCQSLKNEDKFLKELLRAGSRPARGRADANNETNPQPLHQFPKPMNGRAGRGGSVAGGSVPGGRPPSESAMSGSSISGHPHPNLSEGDQALHSWAKSLLRQRHLLVFLLSHELDRITVYHNPLKKPDLQFTDQNLFTAARDRNPEEWKKLLRTAWAVDARLAVRLAERFPDARVQAVLAPELSGYVSRHPEALYHMPEAMPYLVTEYNVAQRSKQLTHLIYWAPCSMAAALSLFDHPFIQNRIVMEYSVHSLRSHSQSEVVFYLPQVVQCLRNDIFGLLAKFLIDASASSMLLAHQVIWICQAERGGIDEDQAENNRKVDSDFQDTVLKLNKAIVKNFKPAEKRFYFEEFRFFDDITNISGVLVPVPRKERKAELAKELARLHCPSSLYLPTMPGFRILRPVYNSGIALSTAKKVPFLCRFEIEECSFARLQQLIDPSGPDFVPDAPAQPRSAVQQIAKAARSLLNKADRIVATLGGDEEDESVDGDSKQHLPIEEEEEEDTPLKRSVTMDFQPPKPVEAKKTNKVTAVIFKVGDDCRQDALAIAIIEACRDIFQSVGLKLFLYPYKVVPNMTKGLIGGVIECVPKNSMTRDQIGKQAPVSLREYYIGKFGRPDGAAFRRAQRNFIVSLAGYALATYLVQAKDRHNGNLMFDDEGYLVHIDFGFIFDISPGRDMRFESAGFKFTKEMVDLIGGGPEHPLYQWFVLLCVRGFLAVREHKEIILTLAERMTSSTLGCFKGNRGKNKVKKPRDVLSIQRLRERFVPDKDEQGAAEYIMQVISEANNHWTTRLYDKIQFRQQGIFYWTNDPDDNE